MTQQLLIALVSGGIINPAFAPLAFWPVAFVAPALLLGLWEKAATKTQAFLYGWVFGLGFFGLGVYWLFISIYVYGQAPVPLAVMIAALLIMTLALFIAAQGIILKWTNSSSTKINRYILFPSTWALMEWVRSWLATGFPWLLLGTTQLEGPLKGLIPYVGVYGVSFITALLAASLLELKRLRSALIPLLAFVVVTGLSWSLGRIQWTHPTGQTQTVSLVQGNIPQRLKWQPEAVFHAMNTYARLTAPHWQSNLIIWPESAVPALDTQVSDFMDWLDNRAEQQATTLITGLLFEKNNRYYNGLAMVGASDGHYYKQHLVPFGEYIPFSHWIGPVMDLFGLPLSQLSAGANSQPLLTLDNAIQMAPFICYEIAYPAFVRQQARHSNAFIVMTDDAWFGRSSAQAQHLAIARMRALENGRPLAFASNNGITSLITAKGMVQAHIEPFKRGVLTAKWTPRQGLTPIGYYGHRSVISVLGLLFLTTVLLGFWHSRSR